MIPTLQHIQPLLKDLSLQPKGRYLLTVYGVNSRRYLYVDTVYAHPTHMDAYRNGNAFPVLILPSGTMWTVIASDVLEYPTLADITRQAKLDAEGATELERELYPNGSATSPSTDPLEPGTVMILSDKPKERKSTLPIGQYL